MALKKHVVAVPVAAQGHLNPLMRFCKLLAAQGVLVTFVNIAPVQHRLDGLDQQQQQQQQEEEEDEASSGATAEEAVIAENLRRVHIPIEGLDLANDFRFSFQPFLEAHNTIAPHLELLIHKLNREGPPVSCILSDIATTMPTQLVADKLNIPRIALVTTCASIMLLSHYATQGRISTSKVLEAFTSRAKRREVICEGLTGLPTIYNDEFPSCRHVVDDSLYVWNFLAKIYQESFLHARAIAINSFEDLEGQALMALSKNLSLPIYGVGPLVEPLNKDSSTSLWKEDEACILWLDQQPPLSVLYISFGSITLVTQPQFEEILEGLLSSQQHFLWVLRPDLVENINYSRTLASDVLSRSHGKGYVVDWAPQLQVLSHLSVGGFLTHCGWNSTTEAIAHGVPMLCWPYILDQMLDAKYVVQEWKVGLQFEASKEGACLVERDEVERVIKALMQGEEGRMLRENAKFLKEAASQSLLPGGTSHKNIQSLIKSFM